MARGVGAAHLPAAERHGTPGVAVHNDVVLEEIRAATLVLVGGVEADDGGEVALVRVHGEVPLPTRRVPGQHAVSTRSARGQHAVSTGGASAHPTRCTSKEPFDNS